MPDSTESGRPHHMTKVLLCVALVAGCGGGVEVNCLRNQIQIATRGMLVKSLTLSGPGCDNATIMSDYPLPEAPDSVRRDAGFMSSGFTPYCQYYYIKPGASGECTVHIELESGVAVDKTTSFSYSNGGSCPGYRIQGSWTWMLTDLFADAGSG